MKATIYAATINFSVAATVVLWALIADLTIASTIVAIVLAVGFVVLGLLIARRGPRG